MTVIARCNGARLVEDGRRIGVVEQGGGRVGTALFVAVLLTVILGVNGAWMVFQMPAAGAVLLAGAALGSAAVVALLRKRRRDRAAPPAPPWLVFDLDAGVLRGGDDSVIAPLDQVRVTRTWQAGSSSKALTVHHGGGKIVIARGTPFGDAVDDVERALAARGIRS